MSELMPCSICGKPEYDQIHHSQMKATAHQYTRATPAPSPSREGWQLSAEDLEEWRNAFNKGGWKGKEQAQLNHMVDMALSALRPAGTDENLAARVKDYLAWAVPSSDGHKLVADLWDALRPAGDEGLRVAAKALADKLDAIDVHPETMAVYCTAQQERGVVYTGPSYKDDLAALKAALHTEKKEGL